MGKTKKQRKEAKRRATHVRKYLRKYDVYHRSEFGRSLAEDIDEYVSKIKKEGIKQ